LSEPLTLRRLSGRAQQQIGAPRSGTPNSGRASRTSLSAFALPAFALYGLFVLVTLVVAVVVSFLHWPVVGRISFVGLANWKAFFSGSGTHALLITAEVIVISLVVQVPLSAALGIFTAGRQRYRAVLSWIFVLPLLISPTGIAINWAKLLDPTFGGLAPFGTQAWLSNAFLAPIIVTLIFTWRITPFYVILIQAAVRAVPIELLESAALDGASRRKQIQFLILPQIRHTLVVVSILCLTGALTAFDLFFVMTGGGPNGATTTLSVGVYLTAFSDQSLGAASAYAVVVTLVGLVFAGVVSRRSGFGSMDSER
jgi:raffinose/stachyose/melibiose transport system permease protein